MSADSELVKCGSDAEDRAGDVVFIHGLDGHPLHTWTNAVTGFNWPEGLAASLPGIGVWSLGYAVASSSWRGTAMPLVERSINALALLDAHGIGSRPLAFICHSMGGLVAKNMIRQALDSGDARWSALAENTTAIVFLATPHSGSGLADWCKRFTLVLRSTVAIDDLAAHEPQLRNLNVWFRNKLGTLPIAVQVYYEKLSTSGVLVVDETSADPGVAGVVPIPLDADHAGICKPASARSLAFRRVSTMLAAQLAPQHDEGVDLDGEPVGNEKPIAVGGGRSADDGVPIHDADDAWDGEDCKAPLSRLETIALALRPSASATDLTQLLSEFLRVAQGLSRQLAALAEACPERLELEPILLSIRHLSFDVLSKVRSLVLDATHVGDFFQEIQQQLRGLLVHTEPAMQRFAAAREATWQSEAEAFLLDEPAEAEAEAAEIDALIRDLCSTDVLDQSEAVARLVGPIRDGFLARVAELPLIQREFLILGLWANADSLIIDGRSRARRVIEFARANTIDPLLREAWELLLEAFSRTTEGSIGIQGFQRVASRLGERDVRTLGRCLMLHPREDVRALALGLIAPADCWAVVVNPEVPLNWLGAIWSYLKPRMAPGGLKIFFVCAADRLAGAIPSHHLSCAVDLVRGFFEVNEFHEDECFRRLDHLRKHVHEQARASGLLLDFDAEFAGRLGDFLRKGPSLLTLSETWRGVPLPIQRVVARRGLFLKFFICHPVDKIAFESLPHLAIRESIVDLVSLPRVNSRLLTELTKSRRLMAPEEVRYAIVKNPKASTLVVGSLIRTLRRDHLKQLAVSRECSGAAREFARRVLDGKGGV